MTYANKMNKTMKRIETLNKIDIYHTLRREGMFLQSSSKGFRDEPSPTTVILSLVMGWGWKAQCPTSSEAHLMSMKQDAS